MESINDIELIEKVKAWLKSMLESNGKAWCLSVPPNPNDPDMLISELCERFESLVTPIPFVFEEGLGLEGEIFSMYDMSDTETRSDAVKHPNVEVDWMRFRARWHNGKLGFLRTGTGMNYLLSSTFLFREEHKNTFEHFKLTCFTPDLM